MRYRTERIKNKKGFTFVEAIVVMALLVISAAIASKGFGLVKGLIFQQTRLVQRMEMEALTYEIVRNVRKARRVVSVANDELNLELYDTATYSSLDRRAYENPIRVRYKFEEENNNSYVTKEIYTSTEPAAPIRSTRKFFKNVQLSPPNDASPYFSPVYVINGSTVGISISFRFLSAYFKQEKVPLKAEVSVYGQGI